MDIAVEIDVLPFDRVCRTCLCTSDGQEDLEAPQMLTMLTQTFGKIVSLEKKKCKQFPLNDDSSLLDYNFE